MNCRDYYYNESHYHFLKQHSILELKSGDILYFYTKNLDREWEVWFGSITEVYSDGVYLTLYSPNLHKKVSVDGADYYWVDAPNKTLPIKLPKTGKKRSQIIQGTMRPIVFYEDKESAIKLTKEFYQKDFFSNKQRIKEMIEQELIIPNEKIDWSYYDEFFPDKDTLIYVKKYPSSSALYHDHKEVGQTISWERVFFTYEEALSYIENLNKEQKRISNLSDKEASKEEVARTITNYINLYLRFKDIDICVEVHYNIMEHIDKFLSKQKIDWEDFYVRLFQGTIEYKKEGNAKWSNLIKAIDDKLSTHLQEYLESKPS